MEDVQVSLLLRILYLAGKALKRRGYPQESNKSLRGQIPPERRVQGAKSVRQDCRDGCPEGYGQVYTSRCHKAVARVVEVIAKVTTKLSLFFDRCLARGSLEIFRS